MKNPAIINMTSEWWKRTPQCCAETPAGWVPARPLGFTSIRYRIKAAWLVWTGRADALIWPGGQ